MRTREQFNDLRSRNPSTSPRFRFVIPPPSDRFDAARRPRTIWTRGKGCAELAETLSSADAIRATGDLMTACVEVRAELLVTKRIPPASFIASATPIDFAPEGAERIVALVGGGPNSTLAAIVAAWLGDTLELPAELVSGYRVPDEEDSAQEVIDRIGPLVPKLGTRPVEAWTAKQLLEEIEDDALLVFGAGGGSWIRRMFLGPGARLAAGAPGGAVVVRDVAPAAFQLMEDPVYVSPLLSAADALRVSDDVMIPVVAFGRLAGVVWRSVLETADGDHQVEALMGAARSLPPHAGREEVVAFYHETGMSPIPVCDGDDRLLGVIRPA